LWSTTGNRKEPLLFVAFVGIVRYIGNHLHPLETALIRYALGLAVLAPIFIRYGLRPFYSRHIPRHALRGAIHGTGVMLWFYAVTQIPLAEVTALSFISPIFVAIGASLFLGEQLTARRIIVIAIGIIGVLIILRPGTAVISFGAIAMLIAAPLFAASKILTKSLVKHDSATTIVAYLSVFATLTMLIPALFVWQTPTLNELCWLFATALFATLKSSLSDARAGAGRCHRGAAGGISAAGVVYLTGSHRVRRTTEHLGLAGCRRDRCQCDLYRSL
jgi:drug/metabolite transporter (DMT)-like permease